MEEVLKIYEDEEGKGREGKGREGELLENEKKEKQEAMEDFLAKLKEMTEDLQRKFRAERQLDLKAGEICEGVTTETVLEWKRERNEALTEAIWNKIKGERPNKKNLTEFLNNAMRFSVGELQVMIVTIADLRREWDPTMHWFLQDLEKELQAMARLKEEIINNEEKPLSENELSALTFFIENIGTAEYNKEKRYVFNRTLPLSTLPNIYQRKFFALLKNNRKVQLTIIIQNMLLYLHVPNKIYEQMLKNELQTSNIESLLQWIKSITPEEKGEYRIL